MGDNVYKTITLGGKVPRMAYAELMKKMQSSSRIEFEVTDTAITMFGMCHGTDLGVESILKHYDLEYDYYLEGDFDSPEIHGKRRQGKDEYEVIGAYGEPAIRRSVLAQLMGHAKDMKGLEDRLNYYYGDDLPKLAPLRIIIGEGQEWA
jgi:hypothetical protein